MLFQFRFLGFEDLICGRGLVVGFGEKVAQGGSFFGFPLFALLVFVFFLYLRYFACTEIPRAVSVGFRLRESQSLDSSYHLLPDSLRGSIS